MGTKPFQVPSQGTEKTLPALRKIPVAMGRRSSSVEKDLKVPVDNKLSVSHAHTHVDKKTDGILGCIRKSIAG